MTQTVKETVLAISVFLFFFLFENINFIWNSKIPWHFPDILAKIQFSLTIMKFPDNSLTLKNFKFPWHFPDAYEPCN